MPDLKHLQQLFYRLIVAPGGVTEGLTREQNLPDGDLDTVIAGDDRMTPVERLEIYANGYFYRLLEVFKEDFRATLAVVGADNFHNLVTGYLIEHPPTKPSIADAGENFAEYLSAHPLRERWAFLADLARLERATLESFHAADAHALDASAMRALAPTAWPALTLRAHPATRLCACAWRVDTLLRAVAD
ncbi:MAG TPA: DNA-binding domain-containing protein, partial [Candidatus Binataceae bacterium]|nr:DNA-binding domain-containing protein [Candidatus Binataceae bacterium]